MTTRFPLYKSPDFHPSKIERRYVRALGGDSPFYRVYEIGVDNRTLSEYDTYGEDIPHDVRLHACQQVGTNVRWL